MTTLNHILLAFIPLFVAVDAVAVLPIFLNLTGELDKREKNRIIIQSMITALGLALGFILIGNVIFRIIGITISDFMIAGGVILFTLALIDLVLPGKERRWPSGDLGVVPLGTPLIVGPAVLTTSLILVSQYGLFPTVVSVCLNILFAGLVFRLSGLLIRVIGEAGTKAISKITSLLLASIGVMLIRRGIEAYF